MIVALDSTVFTSDPECKSLAWRALIHAAQHWDLRIRTTEVVFAESVANYQRNILESQQALAKTAKALAPLGLEYVFDSPIKAIADSGNAYPSHFRALLESCGVEILKITGISHMEVVARAVGRRRPCDAKGDGYRDTLNWLTFLKLVKRNRKQEVVWVSADTDFLSNDASGLHGDLLEEIAELDASTRVFWYRNLKDLVIGLAAERSTYTGDDLHGLADSLQYASILKYVSENVFPGIFPHVLNAYKCGLPIRTTTARLLAVKDSRKLELNVKGPISDDLVLAEFKLEADADIEVDMSDSDPPESDLPLHISKPLIFRGMVTLDIHGRPQSAELWTIEAIADDPGRHAWEDTKALASQFQKLSSAFQDIALPPGYLDFVKNATLPPGYLDFVKDVTLPPGLVENFALPSGLLSDFTLPPGYLDLVQNFTLPPGYLDLVKSFTLPDLVKNFTLAPGLLPNFTLPPSYLQTLSGLGSTSGAAHEEPEGDSDDQQDEDSGEGFDGEDESGNEPD